MQRTVLQVITDSWRRLGSLRKRSKPLSDRPRTRHKGKIKSWHIVLPTMVILMTLTFVLATTPDPNAKFRVEVTATAIEFVSIGDYDAPLLFQKGILEFKALGASKAWYTPPTLLDTTFLDIKQSTDVIIEPDVSSTTHRAVGVLDGFELSPGTRCQFTVDSDTMVRVQTSLPETSSIGRTTVGISRPALLRLNPADSVSASLADGSYVWIESNDHELDCVMELVGEPKESSLLSEHLQIRSAKFLKHDRGIDESSLVDSAKISDRSSRLADRFVNQHDFLRLESREESIWRTSRSSFKESGRLCA